MSEASLFPSKRDGRYLIATPLGGCCNVKYDVNRRIFHGCVASNIAATPQGGSELICDRTVFEGNRSIRYRSFAHPLAMFPEPLKGFSCIIHAYIIHEH